MNTWEFVSHSPLLILVILWTVPWKAVALWKAARRNEVGWFIALLVINTLGILEMVYIFVISKKKSGTETPEKK